MRLVFPPWTQPCYNGPGAEHGFPAYSQSKTDDMSRKQSEDQTCRTKRYSLKLFFNFMIFLRIQSLLRRSNELVNFISVFLNNYFVKPDSTRSVPRKITICQKNIYSSLTVIMAVHCRSALARFSSTEPAETCTLQNISNRLELINIIYLRSIIQFWISNE